LRDNKQIWGQYRVQALRKFLGEAILNALVHRDYSIHTEGMPIQIIMFDDRLEIHNPGGIYGRIKVDQLGKVQPDTRNPVLATALEVMAVTENRYSGIPTIKKEMEKYDLPEPVFEDFRGQFSVAFYNDGSSITKENDIDEAAKELIEFCKVPRTRKEIADHLGLSSLSYAIQAHVMPLVEAGLIKLSIPDKPRSYKQTYFSE